MNGADHAGTTAGEGASAAPAQAADAGNNAVVTEVEANPDESTTGGGGRS